MQTKLVQYIKTVQRTNLALRAREPLPEESPEEEQHDDRDDAGDWAILLQQQLPVDADRGALILGGVLAKTAAHITHLVKTVAAVQQVVDVLRHRLMHILQLIVEAVEVILRAAVLVELLGALKEAFELGVGVGAHTGVKVLFALVRALELFAHVFEVGEGQLLGVASLGDADKHEAVVHHVAAQGRQSRPNGCTLHAPGEVHRPGIVLDLLHGVSIALNAGTRLCRWPQSLDDLTDLLLELA